MRYLTIAQCNDATGDFICGEEYLAAAENLGLEVYTKPWRDPWTDAYGCFYAVRTRHAKRLPSAVRKSIGR